MTEKVKARDGEGLFCEMAVPPNSMNPDFQSGTPLEFVTATKPQSNVGRIRQGVALRRTLILTFLNEVL